MKVALLGDSIRQQYGEQVRQLLGAEYEVWEPKENCRFAKYTLRGLFDWAEDLEGVDVVHWNNGHWDVCRLFEGETFSSEEEYVQDMMRIVDILQKRYRAVIFATTTPVRVENQYSSNEDIDRFNYRIVSLLMERGVIINDLNRLLRADVDKFICDDAIHLTTEGIAVCAERVSECIKDAGKRILPVPEDDARRGYHESEKSSGVPVLL